MAEEKKITDLALTGFYEAMEKTNTKKSPMRCWLGCLRIPATTRVSMQRAGMRKLKIDRGGLAMLFSESHLLSKGRSKQ
jgi:hypothetical protein